MQIVAAGRDELEQLYATRLSAEEMRPRKVASLARLRQELADETAASGAKAPEWLAQPLNNARLASMTWTSYPTSHSTKSLISISPPPLAYPTSKVAEQLS